MPHATWPYRPQEKGSIENGVGFTKSSCFKAHVFEDRRDLEEHLEQWHCRVDDERPSRATGEIPSVRHLLEKPRLRPLGVDPSGFRLRHTRVVRTDSFVEFDRIRYYVGDAHSSWNSSSRPRERSRGGSKNETESDRDAAFPCICSRRPSGA